LSPYIPVYGDSTIETPHISRLAEEGIVYTNVYSTSGVCAPSRATLATGMYHNSIGAHNMRTLNSDQFITQYGFSSYEVVPPAEVKMMSQILRENGYYCTNNAKTDYQFIPSVTAWDESSPYAHWANRPVGKPFFSVYNFDITHESQFFGPTSRRHLRFNENFPPPRTTPIPPWGESIDSSEWELLLPPTADVSVPPYLMDDSVTRDDIRRMYSNIIAMDKQVGLLMQKLEEDGLLDSTIIFWYTDHGGPLPRQKRLMYDAGLRVPMIVRYPDGYKAGKRVDELVSFVDFAPTVYSIAGIKPPDYLQGRAFLGAFEGNEKRKYIHAASDRLDSEYDMIRAVKDDRYKYLKNFRPELPYYMPLEYREGIKSMQQLLAGKEAGILNDYQEQWFRTSKPEEELFDTWNDPHELNNLANNPIYQDKLKELRVECERWMKEIADMGFIPEKELAEKFNPGGVQPVTEKPIIKLKGDSIYVQSPTQGASLGFRLNENEPWLPYTKPLFNSHHKIFFIAHRLGYKPSDEVSFE
ncbi:MAG: sulfatase, partial [Cyclobacteriaceae bacterium]|nr:sulfatase [Cyclobacteriaceae bacterium]